MKKIIGILLLVFALFVGCGDPDDENANLSKLVKIDIANATNLFIAPGSNSRSVGDSDKLFKVTDAGYIQEVSYYDEDGNKITENIFPTEIYNVNDIYIIICFGYGDGYLVRKTDGAVFSLDNVGLPYTYTQQWNHANAKIVQSDSIGNIYYGVNGQSRDIIKINTANPNNLTKVVWIEGGNGDTIYAFDVSPAGHIVYHEIREENRINRIKKTNGGLINISGNSPCWWISLDGNIKYTFYDNSDFKNKMSTVMIASDFQESTTTISVDFSLNIYYLSYQLRFNDRIIICDKGSNKIYEVENPSNTPREISISGIATIKNVVYSNDYYYLSGNNASNQPVLLKVNPKTDVVVTLLSPNKYDIYKMTVDNHNVVSFNAERMSDGVKVIGQVSSPGAEYILDETLNTEIVVLERIR